MPPVCGTPARGRVHRITRLDSCGAPVIGASSVVVGTFVSVQATPTYDDGQALVLQDAWGDYCVDEDDDPTLRSVALQVNHCVIDPSVADITVQGSRSLLTGANATGAAYGTAKSSKRWALEIWQKNTGADACDDGVSWFYWLYRNIGPGKLLALTHARPVLNYNVSAIARPGKMADWPVDLHGDGPWLPAGLGDTEVMAHNIVVQEDAETTPPTPACGAVALADPG